MNGKGSGRRIENVKLINKNWKDINWNEKDKRETHGRGEQGKCRADKKSGKTTCGRA
jgi:hypothetical protein